MSKAMSVMRFAGLLLAAGAAFLGHLAPLGAAQPEPWKMGFQEAASPTME